MLPVDIILMAVEAGLKLDRRLPRVLCGLHQASPDHSAVASRAGRIRHFRLRLTHPPPGH